MKTPKKTCLICFDLFESDFPSQAVCGHACRVKLWANESKRDYEAICTYCGDIPDTVDHVPPVSARKHLMDLDPRTDRSGWITVPACGECNCQILRDLAYWTLEERVKYVAQELKRKYKKLRKVPAWEPAELRKLGATLRKHVLAGVAHAKHIQGRVKFAEAKVTESELWESLENNLEAVSMH